MLKKITLFLFVLIVVMSKRLAAQIWPPDTTITNLADTFSTITKNHSWRVTKYYSSTKQTDKASSFQNYSFRFNQKDPTKFLIEGVTKTITGTWTAEDNKIVFSMPLITMDSLNNSANDSSYNVVAQLLCSGQLKQVALSPSLLGFTLLDALPGEVLIEFRRQD